MRSLMCLAQPSNQDNANAKALLDRGHSVDRIDTDSDSDTDTDGGKEPKDRQHGAPAGAADGVAFQ